MKSLTRIFVALLLAVGITFGGFHSNAHAQSSPLPIPNVSVDVNTTFDQIVNGVRFDRKYSVVVANKTGKTLERVGGYNNMLNWPLGDIQPNTAVGQQFDGNRAYGNSFSFASNYRVQPGKNVQLVAKFPIIGRRKVGLGGINEDGNKAAERIWDQTVDSSDQAVSNAPFQASASIKQKDATLVWYYEIQ